MKLLVIFLLICINTNAQIQKAPGRNEGEGPWPQLIIRGVTLINSTGAPPIGPVDIVIEKNRIISINNVGSPGVPINKERRPKLKDGGKELNAEGMYALPASTIFRLLQNDAVHWHNYNQEDNFVLFYQ